MTAVPEVLLGDFTAVQCRNWRSRARRSLGCLCRNDEYTASVLVTRDVGCRPYRIEDFRSPCGTNRRACRSFSVSVTYPTGLGYTGTEIGKWRPETGAAKPPVQSRKSEICRPRTRAHQHRQGRSPRSGNRQRARGNIGSSRTAGRGRCCVRNRSQFAQRRSPKSRFLILRVFAHRNVCDSPPPSAHAYRARVGHKSKA